MASSPQHCLLPTFCYQEHFLMPINLLAVKQYPEFLPCITYSNGNYIVQFNKTVICWTESQFPNRFKKALHTVGAKETFRNSELIFCIINIDMLLFTSILQKKNITITKKTRSTKLAISPCKSLLHPYKYFLLHASLTAKTFSP